MLLKRACRFPSGSRANRSQEGQVHRLIKEADTTIAKRSDRTMRVVASNIVLKSRGGIDGKRLVEHVATIDPLAIGPTRVFRDNQGVRGTVWNVS